VLFISIALGVIPIISTIKRGSREQFSLLTVFFMFSKSMEAVMWVQGQCCSMYILQYDSISRKSVLRA